jgi:hypothetical protein
VSIGKAGIAGGGKTVTVHKGPSLTADIAFASETYSSDTQFDDQAWTGAGTAAETWTLTALEQGTVYFAVYKDDAQTITVGGTDAARVTKAETGTVDDITASDEQPVFTVNTQDLVFDGGDRSFTLEVSETGKVSKTVTVTLNVAANETGAALFKVTREGGPENPWDPLTGEETLTRLDTGTAEQPAAFNGFEAAFTWLETNAEADTEYLIRVEKDETSLPNLVVSLNLKNNVTLRLRGSKDGPWTLKPLGDNSTNELNKNSITAQKAFIQIGYTDSEHKRTFILGNNITVKTGKARVPQSSKSWTRSIYVGNNATLVLEKGSTITEHDTTGFSSTADSVIYIYGSVTAKQIGDETKYGKIRIEGGSITNCSVPENSPLIYHYVILERLAAGAFYLAPSSILELSGNTNNDLQIKNTTPAWNLEDYLISGLSVPTTE